MWIQNHLEERGKDKAGKLPWEKNWQGYCVLDGVILIPIIPWEMGSY